MTDTLVIGVLLFDGYETLDAHGPIEMLGTPVTKERLKLLTVTESGGRVKSSQGITVVADHSFEDCPALDILLVPGGYGTRQQVLNAKLLSWLVDIYGNEQRPLKYLLSVCTGSAVLAKAGLLDGKKATSNKMSWQWATSQSDKAHWIRHARWVKDGNIITSAGVSAGMDMALFFIAELLGSEVASKVAKFAEYSGQWKDWQQDPWGVEKA